MSTLFTGLRERSFAFALWSAANAAGERPPLLSGLLLEHFSWGSIF